MCLSADKLFKLEDGVMKSPGLYTMWTILYVVNLICLSLDSTTGSVRDFNLLLFITQFTPLLVHIILYMVIICHLVCY